ncbi:hypothetical protein [Mycolicibacterium parafortuitum]|uniref:hypothetical protein n=1 Tax=Mycolicibacterium parafortuitum TaxID=39692 RepID=UPI001F2537C4|nr:hypothetical protein [Mycolicibacterium parafortuitum]
MICVGYALVAFGAYWLAVSPTVAAWEWTLGSLSALAAVAAFVFGFDQLRHVTPAHAVPEQILDSDDSAQPKQSL